MEKFASLSEEKQSMIRNAALSCFAQHGYEKASINDIAVAAGISKASMFQYFGTKQALFEYLMDYCSTQMKEAFDLHSLNTNTDFFDRVWQASVMKVENLKKHPHVAAFITRAAAEDAPEMRETLNAMMKAGEEFTRGFVVHEEDLVKFKHPGDAPLLFQTLMLLGHGMAAQLENGMDYDKVLKEFESILEMLKSNFYKEEYLV